MKRAFKAGTSEGAQRAWTSRRPGQKPLTGSEGHKRWRRARLDSAKRKGRELNTGEMAKAVAAGAFAYREHRHKFEDVLKAGNSDGAQKAWESRRAQGKHVIATGQGFKWHAVSPAWGGKRRGEPSKRHPRPSDEAYQHNPRIGFQAKLKKWGDLF